MDRGINVLGHSNPMFGVAFSTRTATSQLFGSFDRPVKHQIVTGKHHRGCRRCPDVLAVLFSFNAQYKDSFVGKAQFNECFLDRKSVV